MKAAVVALPALAAGAAWLTATWSDAVFVVAAMDWTAVTVGVVSGLAATVAVAGTIWVARRQFSGTYRTATGDGVLGFTEGFLRIQADSLTKAHERIAVLESKVVELEVGWEAERNVRRQLELENARLKAERS